MNAVNGTVCVCVVVVGRGGLRVGVWVGVFPLAAVCVLQEPQQSLWFLRRAGFKQLHMTEEKKNRRRKQRASVRGDEPVTADVLADSVSASEKENLATAHVLMHISADCDGKHRPTCWT